ncbi:unnamed protein product [Ceutorhynchus assimilis]|uniref:Uncharacterized protein n=1 Tax=Ceutorhynchus assimilis TaxID=467358 RepID=A0A9N9MUQ6_9CUCU|nr:unnamed protein product [Ceutorhynchus assimilis]
MSFHNCDHVDKCVPTRVPSQLPQYAHVPQIIWTRSLGADKKPIGFTDTLVGSIYNSFEVIESTNTKKFDHYWGGIFNLEYSLDGKLLVAACEGKQVLIYDSGNQKHIKTVEDAHLNCVNCVKFLDNVTFATGSDDTLIKVWDIRNLKSSTRNIARTF